jgi:hypothetical protein
MANCHLFQRFKNPIPFLRMLKLQLRKQENCIFCLYGNNNPYFRNLVRYPGPLSGLGQLTELKHNPSEHRSVSVRKLFHDNNIKIAHPTSVRMSYMVDNHPFYLKLLSWHALIKTQNTCTPAIAEKALHDLILHYDPLFYEIVEGLSAKQISFLRALAKGKQKFYADTTRKEFQLGSSSNIARLKQSLEKKGIIKRSNAEMVFTNPLFREWLRRCYFKT